MVQQTHLVAQQTQTHLDVVKVVVATISAASSWPGGMMLIPFTGGPRTEYLKASLPSLGFFV